MLTRRTFLHSGVGAALVASGCAITPPRNETTRGDFIFGELRVPENNTATIGAMVGAALGIGIFFAVTRRVPSPLIGTIGFAVTGALVTSHLVTASRDYVDYQIDRADGSLDDGAKIIATEAVIDRVRFEQLTREVNETHRTINMAIESQNAQLADIFEFLLSLRKDIELIREEEERAEKTSAVAEVVSREVDNSSATNVTPKVLESNAISAIRYSKELRALQETILRHS